MPCLSRKSLCLSNNNCDQSQKHLHSSKHILSVSKTNMINVWCDEYTINLIKLHISNTLHTTVSMCWLEIDLNDKYCQQKNCFCFVLFSVVAVILVFFFTKLHEIESIYCHGQATLKVVLYLPTAQSFEKGRLCPAGQDKRQRGTSFPFPLSFPFSTFSFFSFQCWGFNAGPHRSDECSSPETHYQQQRRALIGLLFWQEE